MPSMVDPRNNDITFTEEELQFIAKHEHMKLADIALQKNKYNSLRFDRVLQQINGRQKAKKKLPAWYTNEKIIYPAAISLEQCSSVETAKFKADLLSGNTIIDLTGGMGIDIYYLSKNFKKAIYCEIQEELAEITRYNFDQLGANITTYSGNGLSYLQSAQETIDCIYLDPARRDNLNKKVFQLEDCTPNIIELENDLVSYADTVMVKCAPMLDINLALNQLKQIQKLFIVSLNNECKELLFLLKKEKTEQVTISCINITSKNIEKLDFYKKEESECIANLGPLNQYIYLPNASILKAGAFKLISIKYPVKKLAQNSHLYTSDEIIKDFPGRIFKVITQVKGNQKKVKKYFKGLKRELISRNYPLTTNQIKEKLHITTGSNSDYVIFTQNRESEKLILDCIKIK